jgi:hypothetical protein
MYFPQGWRNCTKWQQSILARHHLHETTQEISRTSATKWRGDTCTLYKNMQDPADVSTSDVCIWCKLSLVCTLVYYAPSNLVLYLIFNSNWNTRSLRVIYNFYTDKKPPPPILIRLPLLLALQSCVTLPLPKLPSFFRPSSTDSSHLHFRFPASPVPSGLRTVSFRQRSSSCILKRCSKHLNFLFLSL